MLLDCLSSFWWSSWSLSSNTSLESEWYPLYCYGPLLSWILCFGFIKQSSVNRGCYFSHSSYFQNVPFYQITLISLVQMCTHVRIINLLKPYVALKVLIFCIYMFIMTWFSILRDYWTSVSIIVKTVKILKVWQGDIAQ